MTPTRCYTALVTPFKEGNLDEDALIDLIQHQINGGIHGLVLCGTTGELPLLNDEEYKRILEVGIKASNSKCHIIAGVGSPSTNKAIHQAKIAQEIGVAGLLVMTPYYVKATQDGVYEHFKSIHDSVNLPIIVYSNPGRTGFEIDEDLLENLVKLVRIVGIKDSPTHITRIEKLGEKFKDSDFAYICGDDGLIDHFITHHAKGWISVISNLYPKESVVSIQQDNDEAFKKIKRKISELVAKSPNPVPIKYALSSILGLCREDVRLPLLPLSQQDKDKIDQVLKK